MLFSIRHFLGIFLVLFACAACGQAQQKQLPLKGPELLALVAGKALNENVVHELSTRGVAFRPTDVYRARLAEAGADAQVLAALNKATIGSAPQSDSSNDLLQHLAAAGRLMRAEKYSRAAQELDAALQSGGGPETAFVMGELLREQEQWPMAAAVYEQLLQQNPDFPEAHTKYSYLLYRMGDSEEGLREAKAALAHNPDNAEAHKNAALALETGRKFDAAAIEYQEALRIKPDYQSVRYDFGNLLREKGDLNGAIAEYEKAIALDPNDAYAHENLGVSYNNKGDYSSAIREYREAKRLKPGDLQVRENLGSSLMSANLNEQAVVEFRELEAMAPDSPLCHMCIGAALYNTGDLNGAEQELNKSIQLDPSDPEAHIRLGSVYEVQKRYDAALAEDRLALQLDENSPDAHRDLGGVLLAVKNFAGAAQELKRAEDLKPSDALTHDLYARALLGLGHPDTAVNEFKQALSLDPKQIPVQLELASVYEKQGDWAASMNLYRRAAAADASIDIRGKVTRNDAPRPQMEFKSAQARFDAHLAELRAAGKSSEATALEAKIASMQASAGLSEKLDTAMQAGFEATSKRQFDEARRKYAEAVELAGKLQPHDQRLATALDYFGMDSIGVDFAAADAAFSRELKVVEEIYGPQTPNVAQPFQSLGTSALVQKNYPAALKYYTSALEADEKGYGANSTAVAMILLPLAQVFVVQKQYGQAEPYLLRAVKIYETSLIQDDNMALLPLNALTYLYQTWGKPEKAAPCEQKMIATLERIYGPDSRYLVPVLTNHAKSLRSLGRNDEAAKVDKRIQTIQATASN
jgi:tetratricopeptide (TPR) repeat protein